MAKTKEEPMDEGQNLRYHVLDAVAVKLMVFSDIGILKATAGTVFALARVLGCSAEVICG